MPYPNEHAARVLSLDSCTDKYGRQEIGNGISRIACKLKANPEKWGTQAYRFKKSQFTAEEAKNWLKEHKIHYMSFEAASD